MSRLTKKIENPQYSNDYEMLCTFDYHLINKLGKLEDIEQDLGCPLEVVFKALKEIYYENEFGDFCRCQRPSLYYSDVLKCWCLESYLGCHTLPLKDYKKNWWLSKTKEE